MQMQEKTKHRVRQAGVVFLAGALTAVVAQADVTVNAGARLNYDSNVNGAPNDSSRLSDTYTSLNASAVYSKALDRAQTAYFIGQAGVLANRYNKYDNLDNTALVASAGLFKQLSSSWSGQVTGRGFNRDAKQDARDSTGWGTTLEIKNQLTPTVWVKGIVDYEDSNANLNSFSYTGKSLGLNIGYLPRPNTFVSLGYNRAILDFKTSAAFRTTSDAYYVEVTQKLTKNWYLNGTVAHQNNDSNIAGTAYNKPMVSLGINYSF